MHKALLALLFISLCATGVRAGDTGLPWVTSEKDAVAQATASGKPLLLYLHADYCEWCKVMEKTTFKDSRVTLLAGEYVLCKLDGEHEGKPLIKRFKVESYPFQAVTDSQENVLLRAPEFQDGDKYAHLLAVPLPQSSLDKLVQTATGEGTAAQKARVTLAVVQAERDDPDAARQTLGNLDLASLVPELRTAAGHAIGAAFARKQKDADAVSYLKQAVSAAPDPRETLVLHTLLAQCDTRLGNTADALAEWDEVQRSHEASKDEKKDAKKRAEALKTQKR